MHLQPAVITADCVVDCFKSRYLRTAIAANRQSRDIRSPKQVRQQYVESHNDDVTEVRSSFRLTIDKRKPPVCVH